METERYVLLNTIDKVKKFVNEIISIDSDVDLLYGRYTLDAKSIMALFSVDLTEVLKVVIHTDDYEELKRFFELMEDFK